jgi:hypothetical protein
MGLRSGLRAGQFIRTIPTWSKYWFTIPAICGLAKEVKVRGGRAPYAGNALKVMPIVPSPATFYDRERP